MKFYFCRIMLELRRIRSEKDDIIKALKKRGLGDVDGQIDQIIDLDEKRRAFQQAHDELLSQSNELSQQIGQLMKEGKREEGNELREKVLRIKEDSKKKGDELKEIEDLLNDLLFKIPNAPADPVPSGNTEEDNEVLEEGEAIKLEMGSPLPHWDIAHKLGIIDFELGNKITGAGFPVYVGKGASLQRALINYFLTKATEAGFTEVLPPILVSRDSAFGTGQLPDKDGQMYHLAEDDLFVIPTAEVPITNIVRDVIFEEKDLPKKFAGYTPCFRREAGSWGAHVRGLNRLHQFDKVEIVQVTDPKNSAEALNQMCDHVSELLKNLGLPFRKLRLCGGDMGFAAEQTIDFEIYSAGQGRWLEVSSVSNFGTFQSNRMKTRFRGEDKKLQLVHTLNGSALALPRVLAGILENNQDETGVNIPEVLRHLTGFTRLDY